MTRIRITRDGSVRGLWTDAVNWHGIGRLAVSNPEPHDPNIRLGSVLGGRLTAMACPNQGKGTLDPRRTCNKS